MILVAMNPRPMRNGKPHPKAYPYWGEIISKLNHEHVIQVGGVEDQPILNDCRLGLPLDQLKQLVLECDTWISIDTFFQHFCWSIGKPGVVIFGQSDPKIFGHKENINLLKDRKYLREKQFWWWEQTEVNNDAFVEPELVVQTVNCILDKYRIGTQH